MPNNAKFTKQALAEAYVSAASQSSHQDGPDTVITGYQPVPSNSGCAAYSLNPAQNTLRLGQEAKLFTRWKCTRLRVHYVPHVPATLEGSITIGTIDFGVTFDNIISHLVNSNGGRSATCWQGFSTVIDTRAYCDRYRSCFGKYEEETSPAIVYATTSTSTGTCSFTLIIEYEYRMRNRATPSASYQHYNVQAAPATYSGPSYLSADEGATRYGLACSSLAGGDFVIPMDSTYPDTSSVLGYYPGSDTTNEVSGSTSAWFTPGTILESFATGSDKRVRRLFDSLAVRQTAEWFITQALQSIILRRIS